jgi:hypothetical protein
VGDAALRPTVTGLDGAEVDFRWTSPDTVRISVRHNGDPTAANVRVSLDVPDATHPHWLIPGLFYGENRPAENTRLYPRFARAVDEPPDHERFVSPSWSFRADRAATPAVFAWGSSGGAAIAAAETSEVGLTGIGFGHAGDTASIHVTFPYVEEPVSYVGQPSPAPAFRATHTWQPGEQHTFEVRLFVLPADRHSYASVLRRLHVGRAGSPRAWVDVETAAELAAYGLHRWHFRPDPPRLIETAAFDRELNDNVGGLGDRQAMHVAWVSGIPYAYGLLAHGERVGNPDYVQAGAQVIDTIVGNLAPSGTFWGQWTAACGWGNGWTARRDGLHARTLAEATLFLHRAARHRPDWLAAVRSNLDVAVRNQRPDGNLGSLLSADDGRVLSWSGAAGLTWVAALAEATELDRRYLDAAARAGRYYARFVDAEFINGAPEDVDLAPSSEDGYAAVLAYMALWRASGEWSWLGLARRAADWTLTFRYSYDVSFDEHTLLGRYGFMTRGADQASPCNQHLHAYGLICLPEMVELAHATGDEHYLQRTHENLACFRQFIARTDGDFNAYRGMATERYYQTECFQSKGMLLTMSHAWSIGVLLLACEAALSQPHIAW